ncbi:uncharacterized protein LOC115242348 [Formica exsecta]|uniref:uncharacterized protein LOC115242348 n=1 Tax=Formica exsecta TaxID=72781 RepID=UPI0011441503|nr:uncharacterized protein LOC115242348 [Formica exsecta]
MSALRHVLCVDDVLFGADSVEAARQIRKQLNILLNRGGFHLRKWISNDLALLRDIPTIEHELAVEHPLKGNDTSKIFDSTWLLREALHVSIPGRDFTYSKSHEVFGSLVYLFDFLWLGVSRNHHGENPNVKSLTHEDRLG